MKRRRAITNGRLAAAMDARVKPGHDGSKGRGRLRYNHFFHLKNRYGAMAATSISTSANG
jgi:hypothetical protein